jgi:uncharacterized protein (TIGR02598 family)
MIPPRIKPSGVRRGFSLVEVTMAIGITAFAGLAVLGLVPVGLSNFHHAMNATVASQILQRVTADVGQADFDTLTSSTSGPTKLPVRYFDEQGNERALADKPIYCVAAGVTVNPSGSLATVIVDILNNPGNQAVQRCENTGGFLPLAGNDSAPTRRTFFVARTK